MPARHRGIDSQTISTFVNQHVVGDHIELARGLWPQREQAVRANNYTLQELAHLDERIFANLLGIELAGARARSLCDATLNADEVESAFVGFWVAACQRDWERVYRWLTAARTNAKLLPGIESACSFMPRSELRLLLARWERSDDAFERALAIEAHLGHRLDPTEKSALQWLQLTVESGLTDREPRLRAVCARAVLVLGFEVLGQLDASLHDRVTQCDVACALIRAGGERRSRALSVLDTIALDDSHPSALQALTYGLRARGHTALERYRLISNRLTALRRHAAALAVGDARLVPELIADIRSGDAPATASLTISLLLGIDLEFLDLTLELPARTDSDDDDSVGESQHARAAGLPIADPDKLEQLCRELISRQATGQRILASEPIDESGLRRVLAEGKQAAREAAAIELGLILPGVLAQVDAPGFLQLHVYAP